MSTNLKPADNSERHFHLRARPSERADVYVEARVRPSDPFAGHTASMRKAVTLGDRLPPDLPRAMRKADSGPPVVVPLNALFPQLNAERRAFDPFKAPRLTSPYRSMKEAGRPTHLLASYLPRDRTTGALLYPQAFAKILQALDSMTGGLDLLPVEHALMASIFPGYPATSDSQGLELMTTLNTEERDNLRAYVRSRLPQFLDLAGDEPAEPVVQRRVG